MISEPHSTSLMLSIATGLRLLTGPERWRMFVLGLLMIIDSALKTASLAAIVPFVMSIVDPVRFLSNPWVEKISMMFGEPSSSDLLIWTGAFALIVLLLKNAFSWFNLRQQTNFQASCEVRLGHFMMGRILQSPYAWVSQFNTQHLRVVVMGHVPVWARGFIGTLLRSAGDALFTILTIALLVYANPVAGAVICLVAVAFSLLIFRFIRPVVEECAQAKRAGHLQGTVLGTQALAGVKDIKMTGREMFFVDKYTEMVKLMAFADSRLKRWQKLPSIAVDVVGFGILILLVISALSYGITPVELASVAALYAVAALRLMPVVSNVIGNISALLATFPMIQDLTDKLSELDRFDQVTSEPSKRFADWTTISFQSVSYNYPSGRSPAVKNLDLQIEFGNVYGIAGSSGAGKSTIVDNLSGLLIATEGSMLVDDSQLTSLIDLRDWRKEVGYVSQTPFMLDATLRENIAFGLIGADIDDVRLLRAVKMANLQSVVDELPDGLDTMIGESAIRLSGGQRQRVAIARALYQDVRILILDEATSALDNVSEREIKKTIAHLAGRLTIVIVAHRLSTLRDCDTIFVIDDGRLVDQGKFDELVTNCTVFRNMVRAADALDSDEIDAVEDTVETSSVSAISTQ